MRKLIITIFTIIFLINPFANTDQDRRNIDIKQLNEDFIIAILKNDFDQVKKLIQQGADLNYRIDQEITVDIYGFSLKELKTELSTINVDQNTFKEEKLPLLKQSIRYNFFIKNMKQENIKNKKSSYFIIGSTPICFAAMIGNIELMNYLLKKGAKLFIQENKEIIQALDHSLNGNVDYFLIENGGYLNGKVNNLVYKLIIKKNMKALNLLMEKGIDVLSIALDNKSYGDYQRMIKNNYGYSSIIYAIMEKFYKQNNIDYDIIQFLVGLGADIYEDVGTLMQFDFRKGIMSHQPYPEFYSFIEYPINKDDFKLLNLMIEKKIDINTRNSNWYTPLQLAVSKGVLDVIEVLLKNGADPTIIDPEGKTLLDYTDDKLDFVDPNRKRINELLKQYDKRSSDKTQPEE